MGVIIEGPFVEGSGNWDTLVNGDFESGNISQWQDDQFGRGSFGATSALAFDGTFSPSSTVQKPSSTVQKVKGLIYADSGLIFAVSLHYILDDFGAGGQF